MNKAGVGTSPWHTRRRAHSIKMDLSFFPRSVKARQVLSDTPKDLTRPLACNSRPCHAFLFHASQGSSMDSAASGPRSWEAGKEVVAGGGGVERRVRGTSGPGLHPWDFPGKNTEVGCQALLQGTFPTQGSNPGLLLCRWILLPLSHRGSPKSTILQFF